MKRYKTMAKENRRNFPLFDVEAGITREAWRAGCRRVATKGCGRQYLSFERRITDEEDYLNRCFSMAGRRGGDRAGAGRYRNRGWNHQGRKRRSGAERHRNSYE